MSIKINEKVGRILNNWQWLKKIFLSILWTPIFQSFFASLATRASVQLRQEANRCNTIMDYVDLASNFLWGNFIDIVPIQVRSEVIELLQILAEERPLRVLEIGTAKGGMLFLLAKISNPEAVIISIDLPMGKFAGGWYPDWKMPLYRSFAQHQQKICLVREDSHSSLTLQRIERILNGRMIDFLLIDGDHSYEGVKMDFLKYNPLVHKGGIIAFHDICSGPKEMVGGVPRFWNEIKSCYKYQEIIGSLGQNGLGIGVIYK
jgi:predicted O-methyltransferase YrrM